VGKIETSGGLGQMWLTPNSLEEGEGKEEEDLIFDICLKMVLFIFVQFL